MTARNVIGPVIAVAAIAYLAYAAIREHRLGSAAGELVGTPAPAFEAPLLDGSTFRLEDARGKVLVVDFWATWCPPCVASLPLVRALHEELGSREDFALVGVAIDADRETVEKTLASVGARWSVAFPGRARASEIAQSYGVTGIPTLVVIDREGTVHSVGHDVAGAAQLARQLLSR